MPAEEASSLRQRFPLGFVVAPNHVGAGERIVHSGHSFVVVIAAAAATIGSAAVAAAGLL